MERSFTPVWTGVDPGCGAGGEVDVSGHAGELWHFPTAPKS